MQIPEQLKSRNSDVLWNDSVSLTGNERATPWNDMSIVVEEVISTDGEIIGRIIQL